MSVCSASCLGLMVELMMIINRINCIERLIPLELVLFTLSKKSSSADLKELGDPVVAS